MQKLLVLSQNLLRRNHVRLFFLAYSIVFVAETYLYFQPACDNSSMFGSVSMVLFLVMVGWGVLLSLPLLIHE